MSETRLYENCPYTVPNLTIFFLFLVLLLIPQSALHYIECRAALNLIWFRAHSEFRIHILHTPFSKTSFPSK